MRTFFGLLFLSGDVLLLIFWLGSLKSGNIINTKYFVVVCSTGMLGFRVLLAAKATNAAVRNTP